MAEYDKVAQLLDGIRYAATVRKVTEWPVEGVVHRIDPEKLMAACEVVKREDVETDEATLLRDDDL